MATQRSAVPRTLLPGLLPGLLAVLLAGACSSAGVPDADARVEGMTGEGIDGDRAPNPQTLYSMAKLMVGRGRDADAETILTRVIAQSPDFMPAYGDLAEVYIRRERIESAVEVLRAGIQRVPQDAVLLNDLGMCRMIQKRYEEALEAFTAAAAGVPRDTRARANMAVALGMLGRYDEALAVYLQILPPADAHYNVAVLCEARKETGRAQREYAAADALASRQEAAHPRH
jgi:Flp pilus assembly protein TadD